MEINDSNYSVNFLPTDKKIEFAGSIRLSGLPDYEKIKDLMNSAYEGLDAADVLTLDFSKLKFLNSSGITTISMFIIQARKKDKLNIRVVGSNEISWQKKSLNNFNKLWDKVQVEILD